MGEAAERLMSPDAYLAWERQQPVKHEFAHGAIVAMAGASRNHNKIVANVCAELHEALRDKPCSEFASDMRVHIATTGNYRYPDASVACEPIPLHDDEFDNLLNPSVIVEVLSDSTEAADRGEKFRDYRTIPSLRDYLLVDQKTAFVEHYTRQPDGSWTLREAGSNDRVKLASCDVELRVSEFYLKVF